MDILKGLKPEAVWGYFEEICQIPRPSRKEEKIGAWLMEFARKHGLEAKQDEAGNVLIVKGASRDGKMRRPWCCSRTWTWCARRIRIRSMISIKIRYSPISTAGG